jgi:phage-related protein
MPAPELSLSPLMIVLIIGLVIVFLVLLVGLFMALQESSRLSDAEKQLQMALAETFSAFQTFGSSVGASLGRLVSKIRVIFERFFGAIVTGTASLLAYLTNALTQIISGVSTLAFGLFSALDKLFLQFQHVVNTLIQQVISAITTVPITVALQIILTFVKLVTDGIHLIFCYVAQGFQYIIDTITPIITDIQNVVEGIATDIAQFFVDLPTILFDEVVAPIAAFFTAALDFLNNTVLQPILDVVNDICGVVCDIANALSISCSC